MSHLTQLEAGWLGGIIDGEGCINLYYSKNDYVSLTLQIGMTHEETIKRVKKFAGVGHIHLTKGKKEAHKDSYFWRCSGLDAIFVLKLVKDVIFTKKEQMVLAFEFGEKCVVGYSGRLTLEQRELAFKMTLQMQLLNKKGKGN